MWLFKKAAQKEEDIPWGRILLNFALHKYGKLTFEVKKGDSFWQMLI